MNKKDHYETTQELYKTCAKEKDGYYDSIKGWPLKHTIWQLRVRKVVLKILNKLLKDDPGISRVIDAGCGRGDFTIELSRHFPRLDLIMGCDNIEEVLTIAKKNKELSENVSFQRADLLEMPFDDNFFDVTTCINVLHHIFNEDLEKVLGELARITKKYLIIEIKNNNNFFYRHAKSSNRGIHQYSTTVDNVSGSLGKYNLQLIDQRNILFFNKVSPLIVLVYKRIDFRE